MGKFRDPALICCISPTRATLSRAAKCKTIYKTIYKTKDETLYRETLYTDKATVFSTHPTHPIPSIPTYCISLNSQQ